MNTTSSADFIERDGTVRKHYMSTEASIKIPLLQALITALFLSVLITVIAWYAGVKAWYSVLGISFLVVSAGAWLLLQRRWYKLVLELEQIFNLDFSGDGKVGAPPELVRIEVSRNDIPGTHQVQIYELEKSLFEKLKYLAPAAISGLPISESAWCGAGKPFSKNEFHQVRDELIKRGWLFWKNPDEHSLGLEVSKVGKVVFKHLSGNRSPTE